MRLIFKKRQRKEKTSMINGERYPGKGLFKGLVKVTKKLSFNAKNKRSNNDKLKKKKKKITDSYFGFCLIKPLKYTKLSGINVQFFFVIKLK